MHILWLILIGFVAGVIAKFLHPGHRTSHPVSSSRRFWASPALSSPPYLDSAGLVSGR